MPLLSNSRTPNEYDNCIQACLRCAQACEECFNACLEEADVQARTRMLKMLNDCAETCFQAVAFMARNSEFAKQHCEMCATICEACAVECERFKDAHCQECARFCRECAEACRRMAGLVTA